MRLYLSFTGPEETGDRVGLEGPPRHMSIRPPRKENPATIFPERPSTLILIAFDGLAGCLVPGDQDQVVDD